MTLPSSTEKTYCEVLDALVGQIPHAKLEPRHVINTVLGDSGKLLSGEVADLT